MEESTAFFYWLSFIILAISFIALFWSFYSALLPIQWFTPVGKTILITGCDSGIGFELAKHFHRKGSTIIATVLSLSSPGALKLEDEFHDRLFLIQLDITKLRDSDDSIRKIKKILVDQKLDLYALINNAGVYVFGEFDFCTFKQIENQIDVNFLGSIYMTKHFLGNIIKAQGRVINTSSVTTLVPYPGSSIYAATKSAIECFSKSLSYELKKFNVRIVCIRLGDYSRLTNIMTNHKYIMADQYENFDDDKKRLYSGYFDRYHQSALENYGLFSPKSYESSSLFDVFDEAVYAVNPRNFIMSATFRYKLVIYFLYFIPTKLKHILFEKITYSMLKKK